MKTGIGLSKEAHSLYPVEYLRTKWVEGKTFETNCSIESREIPRGHVFIRHMSHGSQIAQTSTKFRRYIEPKTPPNPRGTHRT